MDYSRWTLFALAICFVLKTSPISCQSKVREMQNSSEVFKSNFDYYQRVAHKKNLLLDFPTSGFPLIITGRADQNCNIFKT